MNILNHAQWLPFSPGNDDHFFVDTFPSNYPSLPESLCAGWEIRTSPNYRYSGQTRVGPVGTIQYTVRGEGCLRYNNRTYKVLPGQAFLLESPGDYLYNLPDEAPLWEFIFLTFNGEDLLQHFRQFITTHGPVITLDPEHPIVTLLLQIGQRIATKQFKTAEDSAIWLYQMMMELLKVASAEASYPTLIQCVLQHLAQHFTRDINGEELADIAGISLAQFYRVFKTHTGYTPGQYITLQRMRQALYYLRFTHLSIEEIGHRCGFSSGWHLGKICRKVLGHSPSHFRQAATIPPESCWRI
jgi:AraC-like DNA-binding protein